MTERAEEPSAVPIALSFNKMCLCLSNLMDMKTYPNIQTFCFFRGPRRCERPAEDHGGTIRYRRHFVLRLEMWNWPPFLCHAFWITGILFVLQTNWTIILFCFIDFSWRFRIKVLQIEYSLSKRERALTVVVVMRYWMVSVKLGLF